MHPKRPLTVLVGEIREGYSLTPAGRAALEAPIEVIARGFVIGARRVTVLTLKSGGCAPGRRIRRVFEVAS